MIRSKSAKSKKRKASSKTPKKKDAEFKHLFNIDYIKRNTLNLPR